MSTNTDNPARLAEIRRFNTGNSIIRPPTWSVLRGSTEEMAETYRALVEDVDFTFTEERCWKPPSVVEEAANVILYGTQGSPDYRFEGRPLSEIGMENFDIVYADGSRKPLEGLLVGDGETAMRAAVASLPPGSHLERRKYGQPLEIVYGRIPPASVDFDFLSARQAQDTEIARTFRVPDMRFVDEARRELGLPAMQDFLREEAKTITIDRLAARNMIGADMAEHLPAPTQMYLERSAEWENCAGGWFRRNGLYGDF